MILPFVAGRQSQTAISRNVVWEAIYTAICPFSKNDSNSAQWQGSTTKKPKATRHSLWCMKLLNGDLAVEKRKASKMVSF